MHSKRINSSKASTASTTVRLTADYGPQLACNAVFLQLYDSPTHDTSLQPLSQSSCVRSSSQSSVHCALSRIYSSKEPSLGRTGGRRSGNPDHDCCAPHRIRSSHIAKQQAFQRGVGSGNASLRSQFADTTDTIVWTQTAPGILSRHSEQC